MPASPSRASERAPLTLADLYAVTGATPPASLVPPPAFERVVRVARHFSPDHSRIVHTEVRLEEAGPVDVVVSVPTGSGEWRSAVPAAWWCEPTWQRVDAFVEATKAPDSRLGRALTSAWLEFDAPSDAAAPLPGVFAGLDDRQGVPASLSPTGRLRHRLALAADAAEPLHGDALPPAVMEALRRVFERVPDAARLVYVGMMIQRSSPALRLCFLGMVPEQVRAFLHDVGWPGDADALVETVASLADGGPVPHMLHLDVWADGVQPRLGVEFPFQRIEQVWGRLSVGAWLQRLVRAGLASPAKVAALSAWPKYGVYWPTPGAEPQAVFRYVNHVKLVSDGGRLAAKAYLTMETHCWLFPRDQVETYGGPVWLPPELPPSTQRTRPRIPRRS